MANRSLNAAIGVVAPQALRFVATEEPEVLCKGKAGFQGKEVGGISEADCKVCADGLLKYLDYQDGTDYLGTRVTDQDTILDTEVVVCDKPKDLTVNPAPDGKDGSIYTIQPGNNCYKVRDELLGRFGDFPWFCKQWGSTGPEYPCHESTDGTRGCTAINYEPVIPQECKANGSSVVVNADCEDTFMEGSSNTPKSGCSGAYGSYSNGPYEWPCYERDMTANGAMHVMCGSQDHYGYPCQYTISRCGGDSYFFAEFPEWCSGARSWCGGASRSHELDEKMVEGMCNAAGWNYVKVNH